MLLIEARRSAGTDGDGVLVLLPEQDRSLWDRALIAEGQSIVRSCLWRNLPGPCQMQAAINAVHTDAPHAVETDWRQIVALVRPTQRGRPFSGRGAQSCRRPGRGRGSRVGSCRGRRLLLGSYYLLHAVRADFLRRLGRSEQAVAEYDAALELTDNEAEQGFLRRARAVSTLPVTDSDPT